MSVQVNHLKYFDENSRKQKKIFQLLIIDNMVLMKLSMTWNFWINKPTFSEEFRNELVSKLQSKRRFDNQKNYFKNSSRWKIDGPIWVSNENGNLK